MAFGPHSTNPRERRSYAHALRDKAIQSGEPQDKLAALEAGVKLSAQPKGKDLGRQALSAFMRVSGKDKETHPSSSKFSGLDTYQSFVEASRGRSMQVVAGLIGNDVGVKVTVHKPETLEQYIDTVKEGEAHDRVNLAGLRWADGTPADRQKTDAEVLDAAGSNYRQGTHAALVQSTQSTENFYRAVEAVSKPHSRPQ